MKIVLNSKVYLLENILCKKLNKINIYQVLIYLNYNIQSVVVEWNGVIVEPPFFKKIVLADNDKLEILSIVGGG